MNGIGTMLTNPGHSLATSALPNAPVVDEPERARRAALRPAVAAALRSAAGALRRTADRVEPAGSRYSAA
jgi:hypothetical protein